MVDDKTARAVDEPKQPKDYVEQLGISDHFGKAVEHLSSPGSVLLFVFLIVLLLTLGDWVVTHYRSEVLTAWLVEIEANRHQELSACQSTTKDLVNACLDKQTK